jgi:ribosomal protein L35
MAVKKMRPKTKKGVVKRIKVTKGGAKGAKLVVNRINDNHRLIGKPRSRTLKAKRSTTLSKSAEKFKTVI